MKQKIKLKQRQQLRLSQKMMLALSATSVGGLCLYLTFLFFHADRENSVAHTNSINLDAVNKGEIICAYTWEQQIPSSAEIGPQGTSVSEFAQCVKEGMSHSYGLTTPSNEEGINLELPYNGILEEGIDVSLDYKGSAEEGDFYANGNSIKFGIRKGKLYIQYRIKTPKGSTEQVKTITDYAIPTDHNFRNYRFIFDPCTGKGTLLVDLTTVWQHKASANSALINSNENVIIGNNIKATKNETPVIDNFILRKCGSHRQAPIELLAFSAERKDDMVMISWFTASEKGTDEYIVERSFDTKNYEVIGSIKASGHSTSLQAYALVDKRPEHGVNYYRLALSNHSSRSGWLPVIALRYKPAEETKTILSTGR